MTRDEKITRGNNAKALLESTPFCSILDDLLGESFGQFVATGNDEANVRTDIWASAQALQRIRDRLEYFINDAKMEIANAEHDKHQ